MIRPPSTWRELARAAALLGVAAAAGGVLVAWSGVVDISASRGHFAITHWLLAFAMENSVEHHADGIAVPPLDDPALFHLGLNHYQAGCTPCHGAPGQARNPITLQAVPEPPFLPDIVAQWQPNELFWIVMNGVKYTSMPAWPARERDDEVWAIVAALVRLPALDGPAYRAALRRDTAVDPLRIEEDARLIAQAGPVGEDLVACARCHGLTGAGGGEGAFPRLAGLSETYIYEALRAYAGGTRPSGVMAAIAAALPDDAMRALARYYATARAAGGPAIDAAAAPEAARLRGRAVAHDGVPAARVAACVPCHGPGGGARHALYPPLAGQHPTYLRTQLRLWQRAARTGGSATARIMAAAIGALSDDDAAAVALYYATLPADDVPPVDPRRSDG